MATVIRDSITAVALGAASPKTLNVTVPASSTPDAMILAVICSDSDPQGNTITDGTVTATKSISSANHAQIAAFYVLSPSAGVHAIKWTGSGSLGNGTLFGAVYHNVNQVSPISGSASATDPGTVVGLTSSIAASYNGDLLVDFMAFTSGMSATAGPPNTRTLSSTDFGNASSQQSVTANGNNTYFMNWVTNNAGNTKDNLTLILGQSLPIPPSTFKWDFATLMMAGD